MIDQKLTAVGGHDGQFCTNKVFTLREEKWVEELPPMTTARMSPAIVNTPNRDVIVVGGNNDTGYTTTIELFQVHRREWY